MVPLLEVSYLPAVLKDHVFTLGLFGCSFPTSQSWEAIHPQIRDLDRHFETNILDSEMWGMGTTPLPEPASQGVPTHVTICQLNVPFNNVPIPPLLASVRHKAITF